MNKKAVTWGWEIIGKLILVLIVILVLLAIIGMLTGKTNIVWDRIRSIFAFGR